MKEKNPFTFIKTINLFVFFALCVFFMPLILYAQEIPDDKKDIYNPTGFPLPRFVSLSKDITNVRSGPGLQYPIKWVIKKRGLPVEIILEYDHWRKIRDEEGAEGWVFKTLLSGKRTALVIGDKPVDLYKKTGVFFNKKLRNSAVIEPMTVVELKGCGRQFCNILVKGISGLIERKSLWGVYEEEKFD